MSMQVYEAERHHKAFEKISTETIPCADCPTGINTCAFTFDNCYMMLLT